MRNKGSDKYIMIAPSYPPFVGGVERHVSEVHYALRKFGLRGDIIVFHREPPDSQNIDDATWIDFTGRTGKIPPLLKLKPLAKFISLIKKNPDAVLHFHDYSTLYPLLPVLKYLNFLQKTYITFHGWDGIFPPHSKSIKRRFKCAEAAVANISVGDFIPKWYGIKSDLISYGGVDVTRLKSVASDCSKLPLRIAYLGRFERDTCIREAIRALKRYYETCGQKIEIHLYGEGSLKQEFERLQMDASLALKIFPAVNDTTSILKAYPIIFASGYLSILEALCARRVVFAYYNNPIRKDYLQLHPASKSIFFSGNEHEFCNALTLCLNKMNIACESSEGGWQWAELQSWDRLANIYIDLWGKRK